MTVADRLATVRDRIATAALQAGRQPDEIRLVGVSKGFPPEIIAEAVAAGLRDIGENRVQEAAAKIPAVTDLAIERPRWHLVGHLQSNKARAALGLFDTIQSVDSVRIAQTLARVSGRLVPTFLEVQFQRTPDRFGFDPEELETAFEEISRLPNLDVVGFMAVAPLGLDLDGTRQVFRRLRELRDRLQDTHPGRPGLELSMGMSDDYPIAIEEGATVIRIGRAIFAP
jgi:pyridoxal phosphate enzyme (YggS family)